MQCISVTLRSVWDDVRPGGVIKLSLQVSIHPGEDNHCNPAPVLNFCAYCYRAVQPVRKCWKLGRIAERFCGRWVGWEYAGWVVLASSRYFEAINLKPTLLQPFNSLSSGILSSLGSSRHIKGKLKRFVTSGYYIPLWPNVSPISGQTSTVIKPMRRMIRQLCRVVGGG